MRHPRYSANGADDAPDRGSTRRALWAVFFAYFTYSMVVSTLTVALPRIAADLNGMQLFSWALALPGLASALSTLLFGKLSDLYGRRALLILSLAVYLVGAILSAVSRSFEFLIASLSILGFGQGALAPLCFAVLGDLFRPVERGRWAGLLNIPGGIMALVGPVLCGWLVDNYSWRYIFGGLIPFILVAALVILFGLPRSNQRAARRIDVLGLILLTLATTTMLIGLSWGGARYAWDSIPIILLLATSLLAWAIFLWAEARAEQPLLDPRVLFNRTFLTASVTAFLSLFGLTAITAYFPLFLQGVQGASATMTGKLITPFSVMVAFTGVPAGYLLSRTRRYRWMYISGYGILLAALVGLSAFNQDTSLGWALAVSTAAGLGLGAIPTINTLVVQYAVPRKLLGAATGGIFFFVMLGRAIAPAVLGSVLNGRYSLSLQGRLPAELVANVDRATLASLGDPRALLSARAMQDLEARLSSILVQAPALHAEITQAILASLESALKQVFLIGAIAMLISFLLILTIPDRNLGDASPADAGSRPASAE